MFACWNTERRLIIYTLIKQNLLVAAEMTFLVRFFKHRLSFCSCQIMLLASHLSVL